MNKTFFFTFLIIVASFYWRHSQKQKPVLQPPILIKQKTNPIVREQRGTTTPKVKLKKINKLVKTKERITKKTTKYPQLTKEFIPFDEDGNRYITQVFIDGDKLIYHGDVLLGHKKDLEKYKATNEVKQGKPNKWEDGKVPFQMSDHLPHPERITQAIDFINQYTNIKFIERTDEKHFVLITQGENNCYSNVGKIGGQQHIYLSPHCKTREVLHEFMHTIGFFHEQNREDRDEYVEVLWENISKENHAQFKKIPNDFLGVTDRPFDFDSIMLYPSYNFSLDPNQPSIIEINGAIITKKENFLSEEDIERINLAYPID